MPAAAPRAALVSAGTFTVNDPTTLRVTGLPVLGMTLVSYTTLNGSSGYSGLNLVMPFRIIGTLNNTGSAITLASVQDETPQWVGSDLNGANLRVIWDAFPRWKQPFYCPNVA